jgi:hypothetical protein
MSEEKKFKFDIEDGKLKFSVDPNQDGEAVVSGELFLSEGLEEAFKKGEKVEGAKVVDFEFSLSKLIVKLDTDKDGEKLLELEIDLGEAIDEAFSKEKEDEAEAESGAE